MALHAAFWLWLLIFVLGAGLVFFAVVHVSAGASARTAIRAWTHSSAECDAGTRWSPCPSQVRPTQPPFLLPCADASQIITYSDLESDYINPVDASERLNRFLMAEYAAHASVTVLCLLTLNLLPLLANSAMLAWHAKGYVEKQHLVDATRIYPTMQERKKQSLVKLGFYTLLFFYNMYRMIYALVWGKVHALYAGAGSAPVRIPGR